MLPVARVLRPGTTLDLPACDIGLLLLYYNRKGEAEPLKIKLAMSLNHPYSLEWHNSTITKVFPITTSA